MTKIEQFIASIDVENTARVVRHVLSGIDTDLEYYNRQELEQIILSLKPNSPKAIVTICYVLGLYGRWLDENQLGDGCSLYDMARDIDKDNLWKKAKPNAKQKFLSHKQFVRIISEIGVYEQLNPLYYQTLFQSVYEGIYNDDMSVLKNLRASDVHGNKVTLHEDNGHTYDIEISQVLADALIELSKKHQWERMNRYGICRITMKGLFADSVFKSEERKGSAQNGQALRFSLYARLRKITDEYLDFHIYPFQLYISGIMHRIKILLDQNNISLDDAFSSDLRTSTANSIILAELLKSNYLSGLSNFKEIIKGHLEAFNI